MDYQIKLQAFEGPFDLLLHLIDKNEVDIYDIPIAEITKQYLEYIEAMEYLDLDIASEFLVMAATLLSIKARMLLPKPPPELLEDENGDYDPREKLVQDLLEYKRIKEAAAMLESYYKNRQKLHQRPNDESLYSGFFREVNPLEGKTLADLTLAFQTVWQRIKDDKTIRNIQRDVVSIDKMMKKIITRVKSQPTGVLFDQIFAELNSKLHVVVGFMALLELMKMSAVGVQQTEAYGKIYIFPGNLEEYERISG